MKILLGFDSNDLLITKSISLWLSKQARDRPWSMVHRLTQLGSWSIGQISIQITNYVLHPNEKKEEDLVSFTWQVDLKY